MDYVVSRTVNGHEGCWEWRRVISIAHSFLAARFKLQIEQAAVRSKRAAMRVNVDDGLVFGGRLPQTKLRERCEWGYE